MSGKRYTEDHMRDFKVPEPEVACVSCIPKATAWNSVTCSYLETVDLGKHP